MVSDFGEMFDTDLGKIRTTRNVWTLKNLFDFRPRIGDEGYPEHWRPYVMPDDDRAWYHTPRGRLMIVKGYEIVVEIDGV